MTTFYEQRYDPSKVLTHPDFELLDDSAIPGSDCNLACAYTPNHEVKLIKKPMPKPGKGEVVLHIRATGICGSIAMPAAASAYTY